jgi:YVTN family beta-propeller protein
MGGISIVDADGLVPPEVHEPWSGIDVWLDGGPTDVVVDAEGRYAYVSVSMEHVVEVVDVAEQRSVARIPVGSRPISLDLSADGTRLYVANHGGADVSVVDVAARRELRRIRLPGDVADLHPVSVAVAADGVAFVARNATTDLVRIDLATEVATVVDRPEGTGYPLGYAIAAEASADRSRLAVFGAGLRSTYDTATHTWTHVAQDGWDLPAFDATGDRLVIGRTVYDRAGNVVAVLDLREEDLTVLDPTGTLVWAFDERGAHAHEVASGERVQSVPLEWYFSNRSAETDGAVLTPDGTRLLGRVRSGLEIFEVTPAA